VLCGRRYVSNKKDKMSSSSGSSGGGGSGGGGGGSSFDIPVLDVEKMYRSRSSKSSSEPDYIPYNKKGKEFFPRLAQNTGLFWLGGFAAAGGYGMYEGWRSAVNPNLKVRFNSVLNGLSRRGAKAGNALGVVGKKRQCIIYIIMAFLSFSLYSSLDRASQTKAHLLTSFIHQLHF